MTACRRACVYQVQSSAKATKRGNRNCTSPTAVCLASDTFVYGFAVNSNMYNFRNFWKVAFFRSIQECFCKMTCRLHPSEPFVALCERDNELVCDVCLEVSGQHYGHVCTRLDQVAERKK